MHAYTSAGLNNSRPALEKPEPGPPSTFGRRMSASCGSFDVRCWREAGVTTVQASLARLSESLCFRDFSALVFRYQLTPSRFACLAYLGWQLGEQVVCWDAQ